MTDTTWGDHMVTTWEPQGGVTTSPLKRGICGHLGTTPPLA